MKVFTDFSSYLIAKFEGCFVSRRSMKMREMVMWQEFKELVKAKHEVPEPAAEYQASHVHHHKKRTQKSKALRKKLITE